MVQKRTSRRESLASSFLDSLDSLLETLPETPQEEPKPKTAEELKAERIRVRREKVGEAVTMLEVVLETVKKDESKFGRKLIELTSLRPDSITPEFFKEMHCIAPVALNVVLRNRGLLEQKQELETESPDGNFTVIDVHDGLAFEFKQKAESVIMADNGEEAMNIVSTVHCKAL